ncbi:hypothetical protein [Poriferisphaera sp. WC338]|uniref:hypothetical protein n=1 Tax=Poriferisphaera sp. WC338 TaxID=3425129 RepID=UPI003D81BADC
MQLLRFGWMACVCAVLTVVWAGCVVNGEVKGGAIYQTLCVLIEKDVRQEHAVTVDMFRRHLLKLRHGFDVRVLETEGDVRLDAAGVVYLRIMIGDDHEEESFELKQEGNRVTLHTSDRRGVMYGLGHVLRQVRLADIGFYFTDRLEGLRKPTFALRGANGGLKQAMDHRAAVTTGARKYEKSEQVFNYETLLFAGANQKLHGWGSYVPVDFSRFDAKTGKGVNVSVGALAEKYGVDYVAFNSINGIGKWHMKEEWKATDHGRLHGGNACPSIPEAREMIIRTREEFVKRVGKLDAIGFAPSDVAGCECDKCYPWVKTYWGLIKDLGEMVKRYHPETKVLITNQEFDREENAWLFEKISEGEHSWLDGYVYAPTSSENSTYGYNVKNDIYPMDVSGDVNRAFLAAKVKQINGGDGEKLEVWEMPDISHWKRSQYGLEVMDPLLAEVHPRRTFNARPARYEQIFAASFPYVRGMLGYSEGMYDDFNRQFLLRKLWDPKRRARDLARDYYGYYCGDAAGEILSEAVFVGEANYAVSMEDAKEGFEMFYALVKQAEAVMPVYYREGNWRFAMLAKRAAIDLYLLRQWEMQKAVYAEAITLLRHGLESDLGTAMKAAAGVLDAVNESEEMQRLRAEMKRYDDQTDAGNAIRAIAIMDIERRDGVGVTWLRNKIEKTMAAGDDETKRKMIDGVVNYDVVGEGEFYDDCGKLGMQPNFVAGSGEMYYGTGKWGAETRPSQRSYVYAFEKQKGLRFKYAGLDHDAKYEVKLTCSKPSGVSFALGSENHFVVKADGKVVGEVQPREEIVGTYVFELPREAIKDGKLELLFEKAVENGKSVTVSEVWVLKRD